MEEALPVDGEQFKGNFPADNSREEQSKPSGDNSGVREASGSIRTHPHDGVSALPEDHFGNQANANIQQGYEAKGVVLGNVEAGDNSVPKEGKFKGEDGLVGMEFEVGRGEFDSSV